LFLSALLRVVRFKDSSWHDSDMKLFLGLVPLAIGISIACGTSKSAGPQNPSVNAAGPEATVQTTSGNPQESPRCTLTLAGAPAVDGIRLGMTAPEVLALVPGSSDDAQLRASIAQAPSKFGVSGFAIDPAKYQLKDKFTGVTNITFNLLDGRVSSFSFGYNGPEYSHVDKFVEKFLAGHTLPALDQWSGYAGMDSQLKVLTCSDFEVRVFAGGEGGKLNYVLVKDLQAEKTLKDRRAKARAQASPSP
jgi:hypothetical protein